MECGADEKVVKSEKDGYYEISTFDQLITYLKNVESGISGKLINDIEFPENYDDEDDVIGRKTHQKIVLLMAMVIKYQELIQMELKQCYSMIFT